MSVQIYLVTSEKMNNYVEGFDSFLCVTFKKNISISVEYPLFKMKSKGKFLVTKWRRKVAIRRDQISGLCELLVLENFLYKYFIPRL